MDSGNEKVALFWEFIAKEELLKDGMSGETQELLGFIPR